MYNLCDEEEEEEEDGGREDLKDESLENHKMREKMKSLKLKMENLSLNKKVNFYPCPFFFCLSFFSACTRSEFLCW